MLDGRSRAPPAWPSDNISNPAGKCLSCEQQWPLQLPHCRACLPEAEPPVGPGQQALLWSLTGKRRTGQGDTLSEAYRAGPRPGTCYWQSSASQAPTWQQNPIQPDSVPQPPGTSQRGGRGRGFCVWRPDKPMTSPLGTQAQAGPPPPSKVPRRMPGLGVRCLSLLPGRREQEGEGGEKRPQAGKGPVHPAIPAVPRGPPTGNRQAGRGTSASSGDSPRQGV